MRLLDQPDDLGLLGCRVSHASSSPSPLMLFLSRRFSRVRSATTSFKAEASRRRSFTSPDVAARAVSPPNRRLPAPRNSLDQPYYLQAALPPPPPTSRVSSPPPTLSL